MLSSSYLKNSFEFSSEFLTFIVSPLGQRKVTTEPCKCNKLMRLGVAVRDVGTRRTGSSAVPLTDADLRQALRTLES